MDVDDNFYDEIASFIPQPSDYSLDDLDEILRSTDSHLDASLDLSTFVPHNVHDFEMPTGDTFGPAATTADQMQPENFNFSFSAFPSPATTNQSATSPYESHRSSSTSSSMDEDQFNPDEFINFFHDDDVKTEQFTSHTIMNMPVRNTPSPTGSCTSSSGSSTSGIQSDTSSVGYAETKTLTSESGDYESDQKAEDHECTITAPAPPPETITLATTGSFVPSSAMVPISLSMPLTMQTSAPLIVSAAATTATLVQPISVLMPIKTVPLTAATTIVKPTTNIHSTPATLKIEPKLAPKSNNPQTPLKIVTSTAGAVAGKITPPPNSKPKTIFLSSNDFKALMQKMNSNGKSAKITGGINGQMPKIIMKTANGKVVSGNKMSPPSAAVSNTASASTASASHSSTHFTPKIVKANGPLVIKQHPTKVTTGPSVAAAAARASISSTHRTHLNMYKGIIDEKMYKKQQRMIKNRESASLSRKKKKEYVVSLESRINNLEKENYTLKGENSSLRSQLVAFAQTCHCKHGNVSEFILNSLNANTKGGSHHSSNSCGSEHHHVRIAPKPVSKSMKQRMTAANVKKNVAVLFAMAFMVTLNVGNFQTYFNQNSIENSVEQAAEESSAMSAGRHLLWVENEAEFNEKLNRSKRETELEVPPLHFIRPTNRSTVTNSTGDHHRNGTTTREPHRLDSSNQSENLRLASNLHKWIGGNDFLNLSLHDKFGNGLKTPLKGFKLMPNYYDNAIESIDLPLQGPGPGLGAAVKQKRTFYIEQPQYDDNKQPKLDNPKANGNGNGNGNGRHPLDLFKPKLSEEYIRLFKGIKRQDDTFYVLSFNMDHILLPASAYNKSSRPKMSLMLPAGDPSLNGDIVLMQIDCEVVNTTELQLKSDMIPEKLRPNIKYGNVNLHPTPHPNDVANNETGSHEKPRHKMPMKAMADEEQDVRGKPVPRTYFMMGPKTQAAASAFKKKPTIVKLNGSEKVIGGSVLNIKNSTLFARVRETVQGEFAP